MIPQLYRHLWKREWKFFLLFSLLSLLLFLSFTLTFYDDRRILKFYDNFHEISSYDLFVLTMLSIRGIERQIHFFFFFFFLLLLLFYLIFWNISSFQMHEEDILILKLRGTSPLKSQGMFFLLRGLHATLISFASVGFYSLFLLTLDALLHTKTTILTFDTRVFFVSTIECVFFAFLSLPFYTIPFSRKRMIALIRKK